MIYTVTMNPAIDYVMEVGALDSGGTNRSRGESYYPGGKGINVSVVLKSLGMESTALGFTAGFAGRALEEMLRERGVVPQFIRLSSGETRINVKLRDNRRITEINACGPNISAQALEQLFGQLVKLKRGDVLVLAGSIPRTVPEDIYERILERLDGQGAEYAVDATGQLLLRVLKYRPLLIKPNREELGELFGFAPKGEEELLRCGKQLQKMGARNVLISLGAQGALLLSEEGKDYAMPALAPKERVKNTVGAGDSMVAGFLAGYLEEKDVIYAFRLASAAGGASVCSDTLAAGPEIQALMDPSVSALRECSSIF